MREEKILKHLGLIYKVMKDLHCDLAEKEDYYFAGLVGLINGIDNYDNTKSKEITFLYNCIKYSIIREFKFRASKKRNVIPVSLNTVIDKESQTELQDIIPSNMNIEQELIKCEQLKAIYNAIDKLKNSLNKTYFCEYYGINQEPKNIVQIALKYGITSAAVSRGIERAKNKIKKIIKEFL